jgi:hypothetical protein
MRRWLAGALLVTVGFLVTPDAVPIYDGVGSDEPYRYVGRSPAPSAATLSAAVTSGRSAALQLKTGENGPQVLVLYRVTVTPGATLLPAASQGYLFLRAAVMTKPDPVLVHRTTPTDPWVAVPTSRAGRDVLSTPLAALGDYAVVRLPGAKPLASAGLSIVRVLLIGGGILVLLTITVLVLRRPQVEPDPTD